MPRSFFEDLRNPVNEAGQVVVPNSPTGTDMNRTLTGIVVGFKENGDVYVAYNDGHGEVHVALQVPSHIRRASEHTVQRIKEEMKLLNLDERWVPEPWYSRLKEALGEG